MSDVNNLLVRMIKSIDLFSNLTEEEALELAQEFQLWFYSKWSLIIKENTRISDIYILKNWRLEARKSKGVSTLKLGEINSGEIFGEMSYLKGIKTTATVVALENSDIWKISVDKFDKFLKKYEHIYEQIKALMEKREEENKNRMKFKTEEEDDNPSSDDFEIVL